MKQKKFRVIPDMLTDDLLFNQPELLAKGKVKELSC
jgi:hypothetical protein